MASFYANENFPRRTVEALRALGHDVLTTKEAVMQGRRSPIMKSSTSRRGPGAPC
jgi:hypothetical protein